MNKLKFISFALIVIAICFNIRVSGNMNNGISISLNQLVANAQTNVEVTNPITGNPAGGVWYSGSEMTEMRKNTNGYTQTTTTFTCGISASSHDNNVSGHFDCTLQTQQHQNYINIWCCTSSNANTACQYSAQDPDC